MNYKLTPLMMFIFILLWHRPSYPEDPSCHPHVPNTTPTSQKKTKRKVLSLVNLHFSVKLILCGRTLLSNSSLLAIFFFVL